MNTPHGVWLDDLTWEEAASRLADDPVVLVPMVWSRPVRAAAHLPMKSATAIARALAQKLVEDLPVVMTPLLVWEGDTVSEGSRHILRERLDGLRARGVRRLAIVDLGEGDAREAGLAVEVPVLSVCNSAAAPDYATCCMLAIDPRSVRMQLLPNSPRVQAFAGERMMAADVEAARALLKSL